MTQILEQKYYQHADSTQILTIKPIWSLLKPCKIREETNLGFSDSLFRDFCFPLCFGG